MEDIITISGGGYTAKINARVGATCFYLAHESKKANILRVPDYSRPLDNPYLYGMPLLFPQNRISGGKFTFEDREYDFGINEPATNCYIHGELYRTPFEIAEVRGDRARFTFRSQGKYVGYEQDFTVEACYRVGEEGLEIVTTLENHSQINMPVTFAYHTTFNLPFIEGSKASNVSVLVDVESEVERNMATYLPTGKLLPLSGCSLALSRGEFISAKPVSKHYRAGKSGAIVLADQKSGARLYYENDASFAFRLVYNGNADEYICIEPQTSVVDGLSGTFDSDFSQINFVEPMAKRSYHSKIYLK